VAAAIGSGSLSLSLSQSVSLFPPDVYVTRPQNDCTLFLLGGCCCCCCWRSGCTCSSCVATVHSAWGRSRSSFT
jgi:hypothetical protein